MKSKKFVKHVKKNFVLIRMMKMNLKLHDKVRDHCHFTGKFRDATHNFCNLRYKIPKEIPIILFHNGSTYDYHFQQQNLRVNLKAQKKIPKNI